MFGLEDELQIEISILEEKINKREQKIKALITKLSDENKDRSVKINDDSCSKYGHTVLVHEYTKTLDIINKLENIVK